VGRQQRPDRGAVRKGPDASSSSRSVSKLKKSFLNGSRAGAEQTGADVSLGSAEDRADAPACVICFGSLQVSLPFQVQAVHMYACVFRENKH
jgi:hypothetical protein